MITITDPAVERIKQLIEMESVPGLKLRMFVQGGGCSGFQYGFCFDEVANEDDFVQEFSGLTLLVDPISAQYLEGASVDFRDDMYGETLTVTNPMAVSTCGCGASFSTF